VDERGLHTVINYLRGLPLSEKTHGYKGVPYQQIDGVGERDCQLRWDLMEPDVEGKDVLDIGCNLGWFVRKSLDEGAAHAEGVDNDRAVVKTATQLGRGAFYYVDIDANLNSDRSPFDVIFCLSVLQHLKSPDLTFQWMLDHGKVLYIEIPQRSITSLMAEHLQNADLLGESERGRPIYRLKVREAVPA
jgi:2-polyprenyl-3-methyl-5-hydroxy-6-metoxy-1,4-benzoquinol methylase